MLSCGARPSRTPKVEHFQRRFALTLLPRRCPDAVVDLQGGEPTIMKAPNNGSGEVRAIRGRESMPRLVQIVRRSQRQSRAQIISKIIPVAVASYALHLLAEEIKKSHRSGVG